MAWTMVLLIAAWQGIFEKLLDVHVGVMKTEGIKNPPSSIGNFLQEESSVVQFAQEQRPPLALREFIDFVKS